jgi:5-methylcytosine-specific restriction endonuclease McrA
MRFNAHARHDENEKLKSLGQKRCFKCSVIKELTEFRKQSATCYECRPGSPKAILSRTNRLLLKTGVRICPSCKRKKPLSEYSQDVGRVHGHCKECTTKRRGYTPKPYDIKAIRASGHSRCYICKEIKSLSEFNGRKTLCKECKKILRRDYPTNKVRAARIKKQSDGSLTTQYLSHLFNISDVCPYCKKKMGAAEKTLDHIIPLSKGGMHAWYNVLVCCGGCNTKKSAKNLFDPMVLPITQVRIYS